LYCIDMIETTPLSTHLRALARQASPGDRVPAVRRLMADFGVSQQVVQRVLDELKLEGLISAHVGRGTFFTRSLPAGEAGSEAAAARSDRRGRSVLVLHRVPGERRRAAVVFDALQRRLQQAGHRTLEIAYSDPDHARQVLHGLPRFDACVVQNAFQEMPIEMLAAIKRKTDHILIDGTWLIGTDIDAIGFEWGEPLERAVEHLVARGHRRIGFVTTPHPFLANELGRQRWAHMRERPRLADLLHPPLLVDRPSLTDYESHAAAAIAAARGADGRLPISAAVVWGIESGEAFRRQLAAVDIRVPDDLSVVLLGRVDIEDEHAGFFDLVGCSAEEQTQALLDRLAERWASPQATHRLRLMPVRARPGHSVADGG
jgi:DNA-binding LacI/PurR family transcriptional regulator